MKECSKYIGNFILSKVAHKWRNKETGKKNKEIRSGKTATLYE